MKKKLISERGSYTIEATVSLLTMIVAIAFVYSMVKMVIAENIMQHAVDNMALEVSSYVYILDRAGLVIHADENTLQGSNQATSAGVEAVNSAKKAYQTFSENSSNLTDLIGLLDTSEGTAGGSLKSDATNMTVSIKKMFEEIKSIDVDKEFAQGATLAADGLVTLLADKIMSNFYLWKLDAYLPMDKEQFCKSYYIDENSISFENSRVFPGASNNTILVVVEYETTSPYSLFPIKRKVVKQAYTAAWLAEPQ